MTRLTERQRLARRITDLREREATLAARIRKTNLGQDLADVRLVLARKQEELAALPPDPPPANEMAAGVIHEPGTGGPTLTETVATIRALMPPADPRLEAALAEEPSTLVGGAANRAPAGEDIGDPPGLCNVATRKVVA